VEPKAESAIFDHAAEAREAGTAESAQAARNKKVFVEPEVSFPVDVLEATTFFQLADSGGTS